jgi:hypothetical protein
VGGVKLTPQGDAINFLNFKIVPLKKTKKCMITKGNDSIAVTFANFSEVEAKYEYDPIETKLQLQKKLATHKKIGLYSFYPWHC